VSPRSRKRRRSRTAPQTAEQATKLFETLARGFLILLIVVTIPRYIESAWTGLPIWFAIDEMQHFDVIDQFSSGQFASQRDQITDYTYRISRDHFGLLSAAGDDGTKEDLGAFGVSYESQQPPVYYLLLAGPNRFLKLLGTSPPRQVRILRSFSILFYLGTCLVIVFIFNDLAALVEYPRLFGYYVATLFFITDVEQRGYISCDHLSPLIGTLGIWSMVRLWRSGKGSCVFWSALSVTLAFLTKYTSGYLLLLWATNTALFYRRHGLPVMSTMAKNVAPLLLIPLFVGAKLWAHGPEGFTHLPEMSEFFRAVLDPPTPEMALRDVTVQSLPTFFWRFLPWSVTVSLLAMASNLIVSTHYVLVKRQRRAVPVFAACLVSALIVFGAVLLSPRFEEFGFHLFRQYGAYVAIWYTAMLAAPLLFRSRLWNTAAACAGLAMLTGAAVWR
jgi:hypothetical protein